MTEQTVEVLEDVQNVVVLQTIRSFQNSGKLSKKNTLSSINYK